MDKAKAGQRTIKAADWNQIRDFINNFSPQNGGMVNNPNNPFLITVKNVTGSDLPAFSVVKIDAAMYPDLSDTELVVETFNKSVELDGDVPDGTDGENIAIIQEDIPAGQLGKAICSGASLCYINVTTDTEYKYAKSASNGTSLDVSESGGQARIVWRQDGTGTLLAYVILDQMGTPEKETFLLYPNGNWTASDYVKGNLEYIIYDSARKAWVPLVISGTPSQPDLDRCRLVVCQADAPSDVSDTGYSMPYYPLEDNIGVEANKSTVSGESFSDRCGVAFGEHVLSNKRIDYVFRDGRYAFEPFFTKTLLAEGHAGGQSGVWVTINGTQYRVSFPSGTGYNVNMAMTPDVYSGDTITVHVTTNLRYPSNTTVNAVAYPVDYQKNTVLIMPYGNPGWRGWQDVTTDYISADNPSLAYDESLMVVKHWGHSSVINSCAAADARQQFGIFELPLMFYRKVKTNALI